MRYMMLLSGTSPSTPPPPELFEAIMKLGGEATEAGVLLDTAGLLPSVAGVRSREEAVEWASRFMKAHRDHWAGWTGSTDILQVMDPAGGPPAG
jgi:hypothetical protein